MDKNETKRAIVKTLNQYEHQFGNGAAKAILKELAEAFGLFQRDLQELLTCEICKKLCDNQHNYETHIATHGTTTKNEGNEQIVIQDDTALRKWKEEHSITSNSTSPQTEPTVAKETEANNGT